MSVSSTLTDKDIICAVNKYIQKQDKLSSFAEAKLVEDFAKCLKVLALIQHMPVDDTLPMYALLIFRIPVNINNQSVKLSLEWTVPFDLDFKCYFVCPADENATIKISHGSQLFLLELISGVTSTGFIADINQARNARQQEYLSRFEWIRWYEANSEYKFQETTEPMVEGDLTSKMEQVAVNERSTVKTMAVPLKSKRMCSPTSITLRESHINHQMGLQEEEYMNIRNYKVFVGTWNVNGQYPSERLSEWLAVDDEAPDIYAIGFQELDLTKEAYVFTFTPREQQWLNAVLNAMHPKTSYKKVRLVRLIGMMLVVLVQERHLAYVSNIAVSTVGTGIMNKLGNKGGVSIRMDFYNTSMCFVNVHMAAHQDDYERRNEDHDCILQRTAFNTSIHGPPKQISDHDHIYFFGDMNYRITPGSFDVKHLAATGDFGPLLNHDQLLHFKNLRRIFQDYNEAPITFKPTYKYDLNSDDWYTGEKVRNPAWCDRVLWSGNRMENLRYDCHQSLRVSDHKPVSAVFEVGVKELDAKRYNRVYEEVMKKLDKLENECLPQVIVDTNEIIFEPVNFLESQTKYLVVENTGQVPVSFKFIKKLDDCDYCKPWLRVRPCLGFLNPEEKCVVALEVLVDKQTASKLNCGSEQLYDILVLHLEHGKDIFITVTGDYKRSSFGASINALVHIRCPFIDVPVCELLNLESGNPVYIDDQPYGLPKEIWHFIDYLYSKSMLEEGLFTTSGLMKEIAQIRCALDAGVPSGVLPGSCHSVADALLLFLAALREPVIPYDLQSRALQAAPNYAACQQVVTELPIHHRNVFSHLMAFLRELLTYSEHNMCDADTLAMVFGPVLLREPDADTRTQSTPEDRKKQAFLHHFLVNE